MSILGDWVARIIIDHSKVSPALASSERRWDEYYKFIERRDKKQFDITKKSLEDITGIRVSSAAQAKTQISSLSAVEKKAVDSRIKDLSRAEAAYNRQIKLVSDLRLKMLSYASVAITIPVTFLAKKAIQDFTEFQQALQNIKAVIGATASDMVLLTDTAINLSEKFATSPTNIAKAMFELGQAGLDAIEIYHELPSVLQLSAAGLKDVGFTANLITTTLQAFQMESTEASKVADVFSSSNAKSVSSLDKLNASLKYTAGLWSSMGWTLEDLVGTLDTLYDTGVRGEKAGRLLASAINGLQKPSKSASKAITNLLGYADALSPQFNDITQIIEKLSRANADAGDIVKIFGKESAEVINRLVQNYSVLGENIAEVSNQTGATASQAAVQLDTLGKRADVLRVVFGNISKETVGVFEPAMKDIVNSLISFGQTIAKLPSPVKAFIASFALISTASIPVILAINSIAAAAATAGLTMSAFVGAIALAVAPVAAFAVVAGGLASTYSTIRKAQEDWGKSVISSVSELSKQGKSIDSLTKSLNDLFSTGKNTQELKSGLEELANVFPKLRDQLNKNSSDTASAISVLNSEYAKLKKMQADISKNTVLGDSATKLEESILRSKQKISELDAELAALKSKRYFSEIQTGLNAIGKGDLASTFETFAFNLRNGKLNLQDMIKTISNSPASTIMRRWVEEVESVSSEAQEARLNLTRLTTGKYNVKVSVDNKDLSTLERVVDIYDDIEGRVVNAKFKLSMENASAEESGETIAKAISDAIGDSLEDIVIGDQLDMQRLGILPKEGEITNAYKTEYEKMLAAVKSEIAKNGINWWDTFKSNVQSGSFQKIKDDMSAIQGLQNDIRILQDVITLSGEKGDAKASASISEKEKKLAQLQTRYKNLWSVEESQLTSEEKATKNMITFYAVMTGSIDDITGKLKENNDWWKTIINNISGMIDLLNGKGKSGDKDYITSLNKQLSELRSGSGSAVNELMGLASALKSALSQSPEFAGKDEILNVEEIFKQLVIIVEETYSSLLKQLGIELPVQSFINASNKASILRTTLVGLRDSSEANSTAFKILQKSIEDLDKSMLDLKGSSGAISKFDYDASKFKNEFDEKKKSVLDFQLALDSFNANNFEKSLYVIENIDPEKGLPELSENIDESKFSGLARAFRQLSIAEQDVNNKASEYKKYLDDGAISIEEYEAELSKLNILLEMIKNKKKINLELSISSITNVISSIGDIASSFDDMIETLSDGDSEISDIAESIGGSITSIGTAIGLISGPIGGIIALAGIAVSVIGSIFGIFEEEAADSSEEVASKFSTTLMDAVKAAAEEMEDGYKSVGQQLGEYINDGMSDGLDLSSDDMILAFKKYLYQMISTALITASGFEDEIAEIAEDLWNALSPGSVQAAQIKATLENLYDEIDSDGRFDPLEEMISGLVELQNTMDTTTNKSSTTYKNAAEAYEKLYKQMMSFISSQATSTEELNEISLIVSKILSLEDELDELDLGITGGLDDEAISEASDAIDEYALLISELADSLGLSSESISSSISEISDSLTETLTDAILQGSFADFKEAVYNQIVSSITSAIVESELISTRIQALVDSIVSAGTGFSSSDANSILEEIRSIWAEVTDENTPLGSVMMGLRDALADFGLLEISVNSGTVVSAIPSDVRDDLIEAIEGTMESLSQAIAEAGLNSSIETVNITTAHIAQMIASTVSIAQANLTLTGSMIFQLSSGESIADWMENWMEDYLARSSP